MTTNPSEEEVLYILRPLRHIEPSLGVHRVLAILKERNPSWILSEKRLRDIMKRYGLETVAAAASLSAVPEQYNIGPPPFEQSDPRPHPKGWSVTLEASYEKVRPLQPFVRGQFLGPFDWSKVDAKKRGYKMMAFAKPGRGFSDALLHQLDYKANSDRIYRLYGSGGWDWGFTPNADMRILFDEMFAKALANKDTGALYFMYLRLLAAARQVDVSAADLRAQLHAEYGFDPLNAAPNPPKTEAEVAAWHERDERNRLTYREEKMRMLQDLIKLEPRALKHVKLDESGRVIYDEDIQGIDAVFCVPVRKQRDSWRMT